MLFKSKIGLRQIRLKHFSISRYYCSSKMKLLNQEEARQLDLDLFSPSYSFNVSQLMELAGLSVAHALHSVYPKEKVFIVSGPGNNGGDGLVAARHLALLGHSVIVFIPKRKKENELFEHLITQCEGFNGIQVLSDEKWVLGRILNDLNVDVILDALFGFSFKPPVRESFQDIMRDMQESKKPIISVDIPSGWDVEKGPLGSDSLCPSVLISLSAPKKCSLFFKGSHHFLGGRFLPDSIKKKYDLDLPEYRGTDTVVRLP
ncbi:NAD(P)H-hydrate epimerase [Lepeophtheirus salmonis]|uniref:NAD(P)H-hydrate epimerase n=1 Tax=Lepeophtheirus salmonis TaxID=72036 RepID=D3PH29_LEPSM|nr:NAD(P)H-hydrate epimerase-like [Lepeophtheirus salmonis]ADD24575.1 YjeF N-terminal domain-containing protein GH12525 [Lepeophtheirus salmonis]